MISFLKNVFFAGVVIVAVALVAVLLREFDEKTNGGDVERPEHTIKVPSNSRPILAPCDVDK